MRVTLCVDALGPQLTGIGRYTWELCRRLPERPEIASLHFFGRHQLIDDPGRLLRGDRLKIRPRPFRFLDRRRMLSVLRSTVVHGPNFFLPPEAATGVITIHDLSVFRFPETHPAARVREFEQQLANSVGRAAHVITDTETVRREVITEFSLPPERVTAVPLGVDPTFKPLTVGQPSDALRRWGLEPGRYGLCVATFEPRKKLAELIRAWRALPAALRDANPLVLAGGSGWRNEVLLTQVRDAENEGWLRNLGFVDERDLPQLYAGAGLFIYPSIYEGFGLPPLEAMASGTPVLVSNRTCMAEVCGKAAGYFDPDDREGTTFAIESSLSDRKWQDQAKSAGLAQARKFTWDRCVDGTIAVYGSALKAL